jgi:dCMP deaminase
LTAKKTEGQYMIDEFGRPAWDDYFMALAILVSTKSIDPRTKHGCVIVDARHRILSVGYNGPISGSLDINVPLTAPEKYKWLIHAEKNSIYNSNVSLEDSTAYITGFPCTPCFVGLAQVGVKRMVYGPIGSVMLGEVGDTKRKPENMDEINQMLIGQSIKLEEYKGNFMEVFDVMTKYIATKLGENYGK